MGRSREQGAAADLGLWSAKLMAFPARKDSPAKLCPGTWMCLFPQNLFLSSLKDCRISRNWYEIQTVGGTGGYRVDEWMDEWAPPQRAAGAMKRAEVLNSRANRQFPF